MNFHISYLTLNKDNVYSSKFLSALSYQKANTRQQYLIECVISTKKPISDRLF